MKVLAHKTAQIAHLVRSFGACMTAPSVRCHVELALDFNDRFDRYLRDYPEESAASIARHITRAISHDPAVEEPPFDEELYSRVLPDVLYVLGLSVEQDEEAAAPEASSLDASLKSVS